MADKNKNTLRDAKKKMKEFINSEPTTANMGVQESGMAMEAEKAIKKRKKELEDIIKKMEEKN